MGRYSDRYKKEKEEAVSVNTEQSSSGNTGNIQAAGRYRERYEQEKKYQNVADTLSKYTDMYQSTAAKVTDGASKYNSNAGKEYIKSLPQYIYAQHDLNKLKKEVNKNKDFYGEDMADAVTQYANALGSGLGEMRQAQRETANYMKNFKDESDYNLSRKYAGLGYDDAMAKISEIDKQMQSGSASGMKQSEDKTWLENHYNVFKDANDFNMYRKYGSASYEDIQNNIAELESAAKSYGTSDSSEQEKINSSLAWLKNRASELRITHAAEIGWDDKYEELKSIEEKLSTPVMYRKGTIDYWDGLEERKNELLSEINNADDIITDYSNNEGRMAKEEYDKYIEDNANKSFLGAMGQAVMTGVASVNSSLGEFTDSTLGELFRKIENSKAGQYLGIDLPGEEIGKTNEDARTAAEEQQEKMAVNKLKYNNSMQQAGIDIMQGVGTSIPSLVMSLVTAGMGGSGAVAASTASVASDAKISDMISNYIMNLAKDPQYWMSFAQMEGDTYASAKAEGATDAQASAAALINGTLGSIIEVGSGVETQVGKANSIMNFLRSAAEEGNEEVLQGIWENATKKAIYDHDREIASLSNDDAVLNPMRSLTEWSLGAAAGAVMSGGAAAFNAASGKIKGAKADYANGNAIIEYGSVDALLKAAENIDSDNVSKAAAAVSEQVKSGKVDAESVGRLSRVIGEQSYKNTVSQLKESLSAEGVSDKTARKVLDIAERDMTGQEITSEDVLYINNNKTVKGIYNSYVGPAVTTNMSAMGDYANAYTGQNIVNSGALDSLLAEAGQNGSTAAAELAENIKNSPEVSAKDVGRLATLMNMSEAGKAQPLKQESSESINEPVVQQAAPEQSSEHSWYDDYIPEGDEVTQSIPVREAVLNDGRTVTVKKFNGIDENATVHTDEGDIPVSQIKLTDTADAILNFVRKNKYSAGVANTMLADYGLNAGTETDAGVGAFATAFAHMYNYGRAGFDIKDAYAGVADNVMLYGQYKAAYELGVRDKAAEVKAAQDKKNVKNRAKKEITFDIKEKGSYSDKVSFDDNVDMKEFNGNEKLSGAAKVLSVVSDATGVKVKIFDGSTKLGDRTISAEGIYYDGTVYLNMRAGNFGENAIMRTAAHELTHYIQEASPKMYADLKKAIIDTYYKGSEDTFAGLVREKQDVYKNMSLEEISDEVIADACEMMLKDGSAVNKLMKDNITLGNRIKTWIDAFLDKIKAAFTKAFKGVEVSKSEAYKLMTAAGENINDIQKLWNDALSSADNTNIGNQDEQYRYADWNKYLSKEEQAMFYSKIGEIKQGKAAQFPESSLSWFKRQSGKETEVTERMLVINNKIVYTDGDYINPQINDVYIFEIGLNPDEQNVNEIYYMVEMAMEDFIYYEEISKFGRVYQTGSNDTGRNKEIFEAMRTLDKKTKTQVDRGRIRIRRKRGPGETNNRVISETGGSGTIQRSAVRISGTESESDTRTDNSRGKQNSGRNEERAGEGVSGGKKPQLSIDEHGLYSRSSTSLTPRVLLSTMSYMDVENLSKEESEALSQYRDTLNKYNGFAEKRAEVGMRLNELKAESNQTADIKERIKRTQDTLDSMNDKVRETATKLQEMEQSKILHDMYETELRRATKDTEHRLYPNSTSLTPRVLLSTMSDMDVKKLSKEKSKTLSEYRDTLRKYNDFDEKRAAARMRLNALNAESNQTADVKEHIKRTQDTLDRMDTKLKETDAKLQEMERSDTMRTMYEAELRRTIKDRDVRTRNVIKTEHTLRRAALESQRKFYVASQRRRSEKSIKTAIRNQIVKIAGEFDSMLKNPTEKKYVPVNLVRPVIQMLNSVNMDAGQEMRLMKLENKINLETDPAERQRLMDRYTSLYANMENGQAKLAETVRLYSSLENDPVYSHEYDPVIEKLLNELADDIGSTPLYEMTLKQLEHTREVMGALRKTVSDSTKMLASDIKERTDECARKCNLEISSRKAAKGPLALLQRFKDTMLTPERMFNSIGGYVKNGMMSRLGTMLNNGQLKQTRLMQQGSNIFRELVADDNLKSLNSTKDMVDIGLVDKEGNPVMITRAQMLSIYMHLQSKDNRRHLIYGGMTAPEQKLYSKGKTSEAYNKGSIVHGIGVDLDAISAKLDGDIELSEDERISLKKQYKQIVREAETRWDSVADNIEKSMTDYEKKWIEKADYFFNTFCRDNLNETTLELYGFKKARVQKYFPIHADKDYLDVAPEGLKMDATLENMGFLKSRTGFSKNPVYLEDMTRVIQRQLDSVSRFCGMAIPLRNFKKVYSATYGGYAESVRKTIEKNYGAHGVEYIEKLITDLEGGGKGQSTVADKIFNGLRGNTASAVLTLNLPVTVGQAASYPTAAAEMDWPSLAKAFFRGGRNNWVFSAADRELIAEYTPLLWYRNQGNSTTELGDIQSRSTWYGSSKAVSKLKHFGLDWIQSMDTATVGRLWYAAQYYVNSHNPELKAGLDEYTKADVKDNLQEKNDAYYSKVAEVFNKVVENTQPDYTTMQRPDILRSNNALVKQMTMFMTQRLQNFNIVYDAAAELICYSRDAKRGLNGVTKEDVKEKSERFVRAVVSQMAATATLVAGKAICNFLLHNVKGFRDDDDDITAESIANTLKDQFIESLCANIVGGSELYSLINSIVSDKYYYGIQLSALSSVTDMASHLKNLSDAAESGDKSKITKQIWNLVDDVSKVFGVPVANAKKLYNAGKYHAIDIKNGQFFKFMSDVETSESKKVDGIIELLKSGSGTDDINAMVEETAQSIASEYPAYEEDKVHSQAVSKVKAKFTARLKSRYLNGDDNEKDDVVNVMINSGLYGDMNEVKDTCMDWVISKLKDEYIRAASMTERNDIRRQLFNTGHWKSLSKLDEYLKGLVSNK